MKNRKILVTSALPYANGPIHIGHLVEYIQTDIWVRFQKMSGHECYYICASDAHGTPIMLKAEEEGISPETLVTKTREEHLEHFSGFSIEFDNFHTTHSEENKHIVEQIYSSLLDEGHIKKQPVQQFFDPVKTMFLPDRFIRGTCPSCGAPDQYGDSCEKCGSTYSPLDLIDPRSVLTSSPPEIKESEHLFFSLSAFTDVLLDWMEGADLHPSVKNKLNEWFKIGLKDWDISRDEPYFGFKIPDNPGKYFYVWLDAPIGYLGSFKNFCEKKSMNFDHLVREAADLEMFHFVGKDIMYFHTLFWPALLSASGFKLPSNVFVHGFLTVNGQKMSKSRGTFITAKQYLENLDPEHLRYYFAAKIGSSIEDIDLNLEDYTFRVNADLVGKFVNIGSRCAGFLENNFAGRLGGAVENPELLEKFQHSFDVISEGYEKREYRKVIRVVMGLADDANRYIDDKKPWRIAKDKSKNEELHDVITQGILMFRLLAIYLKPVLPELVGKVERFLNESNLVFSDIYNVPLNKKISKFGRLTDRIAQEKVDSLQAKPKEGNMQKEDKETEQYISIEDFKKIDFRVATIIAAKEIEKSDKLIELELDLGDRTSTVFAGIKGKYEVAELLDRKVVCVANLKPRKMRFGISEGMILAASGDKEGLFLLGPDDGAATGMIVS